MSTSTTPTIRTRRPIHCSACHQPGHNRSNRICPVRIAAVSAINYERLQQLRRKGDNMIELIHVLIDISNQSLEAAMSFFGIPSMPNIMTSQLDRLLQKTLDLISEIMIINEFEGFTELIHHRLLVSTWLIEDRLNPIIYNYKELLDERMAASTITTSTRTYYYRLTETLNRTVRPDISLPSQVSPLLQINHNNRNNEKFDINIMTKVNTNCSQYDCPICMDIKTPETGCNTNCSHEFCVDCMMNLLSQTRARYKNQVSCPMCRTEIKNINVHSQDQVRKISDYGHVV